MSIFISSNIYLAALAEMPHIVRNRPLIGWQSIFAPSNIAYAGNYPSGSGNNIRFNARNVWSPDTHTSFRSSTNLSGQTINVNLIFQQLSAQPVDYGAIVGHNFASQGIAYKWQYNNTIPVNYIDLTDYRIPDSDGPIIDHFDEIADATSIRLATRSPDGTFVAIGHVKLGKILQLQRPNSGNPYPVGRTRSVIGEALEGDFGDYLGMIVRSEYTPWEIDQKNNRPEFVRDKIYQFIAHMNGTIQGQIGPSGTFFYAWLPDDYPTEVAYCWKDPRQDVTPRHSPTNNLMSWSCNGKGAL